MIGQVEIAYPRASVVHVSGGNLMLAVPVLTMLSVIAFAAMRECMVRRTEKRRRG